MPQINYHWDTSGHALNKLMKKYLNFIFFEDQRRRARKNVDKR